MNLATAIWKPLPEVERNDLVEIQSSPDSPPPEFLLGYVRPAIVCATGSIPLWFSVDEFPNRDLLEPLYRTLCRSADEVFRFAFQQRCP